MPHDTVVCLGGFGVVWFDQHATACFAHPQSRLSKLPFSPVCPNTDGKASSTSPPDALPVGGRGHQAAVGV